MSAKRGAEFSFTGHEIAMTGENSIVRLDLGDIESFINSVDRTNLKTKLQDINLAIAQTGMKNNHIEWWCFNAATRNPLASKFIYLMLAFLCCVEKIESGQIKSTVVMENAPDLLKIALVRHFNTRIPLIERFTLFSKAVLRSFANIARLTVQLFQAWCVSYRYPVKEIPANSVALFTFVDGSVHHNGDPYFGNLSDLLKQELPETTVEHLAYVYRPYLKRIKGGEIDLTGNYSLLLSFLSLPDYIDSWFKYFAMSIVLPRLQMPRSIRYEDAFRIILKGTLRNEISRGALENYLIYKAFHNIGKSGKFKRIIYPFENKSIEKCLLKGLDSSSSVKIIGYQHSSITKRHFAMQLVPGEFEKIPMPDHIVAVGDVTRSWLIENGFPETFVRSGCSLRHKLDFNTKRARTANETPHILFALSSSKYELESTVAFMQELKEKHNSWVLAIRCHPNFPSSLLNDEPRRWLKDNVIEFTGTSLQKNLEWCEVLGYVSSTVALEALAAGIPIIRFGTEVLNSDPLLEHPPFCRECYTVEEFITSVDEFRAMSIDTRNDAVVAARSYVCSYLKPYSDSIVMEFVA